MRIFNHLKISTFLVFFSLIISQASFAGDTKEGEEFNPGPLINHHIADAHEWHLWGHTAIYLPVILKSEDGFKVFSSSHLYHNEKQAEVKGEQISYYAYGGFSMYHEHIYVGEELVFDEEGHPTNATPLDISITKNVAMLFINALVMFMVFFSVARGYKKNVGKAPKGIQSFFEPIIVFVRDEIVKPNIGPKYEKFLPYLLTLFFFIWFGNLLGLLPAAANLTGNIAVCLVLAVLTLIITVANGRKAYWLHIVDPLGNSLPWAAKILLYLILWPIEILGIFIKPASLTIRLFANITAGHIIILSILSLTFIAQSLAVGVVASIFASVMNLLELFVALLQAYVFTLLTSMYFGQAVEEGHH